MISGKILEQKIRDHKEEKDIKESMFSDEVRTAMQDLKKHLNLKANELDQKTAANFGFITANLSKNLLNVLESMNKSNIPEKVDCGIVEDTETQV
jgi:hypothetical protein